MRRRIHTQGDFDGACFLYAIANAYTALTGRRPELEAWDEGIRAIPHALDFLQGCVGTTQHHEKDADLLCNTVTAMLAAFSGKGASPSVEFCPHVSDLASVAQLVGQRSVVVFNYKGETRHVRAGDHWVCAVAVDGDPLTVHVACSIRRSDDGRFNDREYVETHHRDADRYSNDCIAEEHMTEIVAGTAFKILAPGQQH